MTQGQGNKKIDTKVEQISLSSPLYLHPSDSPSLMLTQILFDGDNYALWANAVQNGLDAKNKLGFIEGVVQKPVTPGNEETLEAVAWRQCNTMVKVWLRNVIYIKLYPGIAFSETVMEIWKELRDRYSTGNEPRIHRLKNDINECKQGKTQYLVEYYTQLKSIWDELAKYSQVPQCTCGAATTMLKEREDAKVHQFLMGLDNVLCGHVRLNILMEDEIKSLSKAYAIVLRKERHKNVTKVKEETTEEAMAAQTSNPTIKFRGNEGTKDKVELGVIQCTL